LVFPSVSLYITTMLITQTGISRDIYDKRIYKRGTSVSDSRKLLMVNDKPNEQAFLNPDDANNIYNKLNMQTHRELIETYAKIAMRKKFEDVGLGQLLILTGKSDLVWNDPNDIILGTGTKKKRGENVCGKILSEIRSDILQNPQKYDLDKPLPTDINLAIASDQFLNSWMKMRLADMCSVVYKMKQYLSIIGKQEEEIDARFVNFVLNLVFQPCSGLIVSSNQNQIPMPDYFVNIVNECQGLPEKLSKDYDSEINSIRKDINDYDDIFWGRTIKKQESKPKKQMSAENFAKNLDAFRNTIPPPTEEEFRSYEKALIAEYKGIESVREVSFDERQRIEWELFMEKINKPEMSTEDINANLDKLKKKHAKSLKRVTDVSTRTKLLAEQKKEQFNLWKKLTQPKLSVEERNIMMKEFQDQQEAERRQHYGWNIKTKTKEELARRQEIIKDFRERIVVLSKQKRDEQNHLVFNITDIAKVYWDRIASMISVIASKIKNVSRAQVREIIVKSELLNSNNVTCENIPENLNNSVDNCIASALSNILVGIEAFKFQYQEDIPFGNADIDLAVGILLGRDVEQTKTETEDEKVEFTDEKNEFNDNEFEDDMGVEEREYDYGDEFEDGGEEREDFGFAKFRMRNPKEYDEKVRMVLSEIPRKPYSGSIGDDIVQHFIDSINKIKKSNVPDRIKKNRINFFATVR